MKKTSISHLLCIGEIIEWHRLKIIFLYIFYYSSDNKRWQRDVVQEDVPNQVDARRRVAPSATVAAALVAAAPAVAVAVVRAAVVRVVAAAPAAVAAAAPTASAEAALARRSRPT